MDKSNSTIKAGCVLFLRGWDDCEVLSIALRKHVRRTLWITSQKYQAEAVRLKSNQVPYCLPTNCAEWVKNIISLDVHRFLNSQEIKKNRTYFLMKLYPGERWLVHSSQQVPLLSFKSDMSQSELLLFSPLTWMPTPDPVFSVPANIFIILPATLFTLQKWPPLISRP